MIKIAVVGVAGRMGQAICNSIINSSHLSQDYKLSFVCSSQKEKQKQNLGTILGVENLDLKIHQSITDSPVDGKVDFDVLIDFTTPTASLKHLDFCKKHQKPIVIGTTGFSEEQIKLIQNTANHIPVVFSPNMSIGVNLAFKTIEFLASVLDDDFDAEIIESHHKNKVDSPSGTALKMGQIIAGARGVNFEEKKELRTFGIIGKRKKGEIGFSAIRAGDIVGEHKVLFATDGEMIELTHRSSSRINYAKGAVLAALFSAKKNQKNEVGLFDMFDVLNLNQLNSN